MRTAPVGHQCVDCVDAAARSVRQPTTAFGGRQNTTPLVSYVLIAVNVVMFVLQTVSSDLERQLVLWAPGVAYFDDYYRLLTSAFLHYGIVHLLFNMWALYIVGPQLEMWLGRLRFTALYFLSAIGGSVLVYLLSPLDTATAGASGAIFGLFGATFVLGRKLNIDVKWVVGLIVLNLVITFVGPQLGTGAISWQGHVGGLVTGAAVSWAYAYPPREHRNVVQAGVTVAVLVLFAALIWLRTASLLTGVG
jgi:membrane associated rhomboid family serine protease